MVDEGRALESGRIGVAASLEHRQRHRLLTRQTLIANTGLPHITLMASTISLHGAHDSATRRLVSEIAFALWDASSTSCTPSCSVRLDGASRNSHLCLCILVPALGTKTRGGGREGRTPGEGGGERDQ